MSSDRPDPVDAPSDTQGGGASFDASATSPFDASEDGPHGLPAAVGGRFGRYTVLGELGQGGMGTVFKAWDPVLDRPVALKVLHAGRMAGDRATRRFLNEARAVARLDHPHIVEIHDMGLLEGAPFFTMALVDGPDLLRWLDRGERPDARHVCRLLAPVGRALDHAHRAGIIHRDVKPANIIVGEDGSARLVDFGVARLADTDLTRTGQVVGTPAFMAPEQARGQADIDRRVDVYGLGAVLYWAVTGAVPPRERSLAPTGVDRDLAAICLAALARDRAERYPDCAALAADLERYARREPVAAARPGLARRARWWLRRRRAVVFAVGGLALGLAGGQALLSTLAERRAQAERSAREASAAERLGRTAREMEALRATGRAGEATALRAAVVGRLDVQGTTALARFQLAEGERALALGQDDAADAFAAAYVQGEAADVRTQALVGLGEHHRRRGEPGPMNAVLDAAGRLGTLDDPAFARLRRDRALFDHDLDAAAGFAEPRTARVLRALSATTATALPRERSPRTAGQPAARIDLPSDVVGLAGQGTVALLRVGFDLVAPQPGLPVVGVIPEPSDGRWVEPPFVGRDPAGRAVLFGRVRAAEGGRPAAALYRWDGPAPLVPLWRDESLESLGPTVQVDLDGDGRAPIWFSPPWTLHALAPDGPDRWRLTTPDRRLPRAGSITYGLAGVQTTDGPALAVALGEWRAYDLRILRPAPDEARLALRGRRKLGHLTGVAPAGPDALWVLATGKAIDPRMFRVAPDRPMLFRVAVGDEAPEVSTGVPLPRPFRGVARVPITLRPALDGPDVVAFAHHGTPWGAALVIDPEHAPEVVPLPGLAPLLAADLDGDGDDELIVRAGDEGAVRVLGAGGERLPRAAIRATRPMDGVDAMGDARAGMPSDGMPSDAMPSDAIDGIEDVMPDAIGDDTVAGPGDPIGTLVALGRLRAARDQLRLRAELGRDPVTTHLRAGRLSLRIDDPAGAAEDFAEAAARASGVTARAAWKAAADAHRRLRRADAERVALRAWAALSPADERAAVDARIRALAARPVYPLDFTGPLHAGWSFEMPDRVRRVASRGVLAIDARMEDARLATLPLRSDGGAVQIAGALALTRGEFSSTLVIGLSRRGPAPDPQRWSRPEAALMVGVGRVSAGQAVLLRTSSGPRERDLEPLPIDGVAQVPSTPFRIVLDAPAGEAFVEWGAGDAARRATLSLPRFEGPVEGIDLTLGTRRLPGGGDSLLQAELGPIAITGAEPVPGHDSPAATARRALADGRPSDARAALADGGSGLDRAASNEALDDTAAADAALLAINDAAARARLLAGWMHDRPGETFDRVSRLWGPDAAARCFLTTWGIAMQTHPRDAAVREAVAAVEARFDPDAVSPALATELLGRLAESAAVLGRVRRARRAFDRLLASMPADPEPIVEDRIVGWMLRRAGLEAEHGSPEAARDWLARAVGRSGVPELVGDYIRASAVLAPLMPAHEPGTGQREAP